MPRSLAWVLVLLGLSVFINYIDRGSLSIAAPSLKDELKITPEQLGFLLSAFFWTYACLQPVYGWLVDRVNVYWLLAGGFGVWSAATAATGFIRTFSALCALRLLVGIGEAVSYPAYSKIIALNYPEEHRGLANSVIASGLCLGPGFGMLLGGMMIARVGWREYFILLGSLSLIWIPAWMKWRPAGSIPRVEDAHGLPRLREFLVLRSAWGTCIGLWCINYVNYFLLTWLPYYLVNERHFSLTRMAKVGAAGYLVSACCSTLCGWLSDRWVRAGGTPTVVRKTFTGGSIGVCGIVLGLCPLAGQSTCVLLLILGMALFGATSSNVYAITQRLAGPQAAGRWTGFQNGFGNLAGVVVPVVTGFAVSRTGHFLAAFAALTAVAIAGAATWIFLVGPIEPVAWGRKIQPATDFAGRSA
ncbi:MAG TPA: MFS transporter [Terriglobales bacterium]|nr:MFS transporter [Terriglobales bacterium]